MIKYGLAITRKHANLPTENNGDDHSQLDIILKNDKFKLVSRSLSFKSVTKLLSHSIKAKQVI